MKIKLEKKAKKKINLKQSKTKQKAKKIKVKNRSKLIFFKGTITFFIANQNCHSDRTYDGMESNTL